MKLKLPISISNLKADDPNFVIFLSQIFQQLNTILNGDVGFTDNCKTDLVTVTFNAANKQQAIAHGLNQIPTGYFVVRSSAALQLYDGSTAWTPQALYVQSTVATKASLLIF